ncbi:hypothetical protein GCM10007897_43710 [Sphingobium jiangsuense]|uniref:Uncharacterized protein n=1 Tax=Sphingobium jiangsuense TaxID=870476 RepID=A0A7W6BK14_9SPHN|nr:hypothetical protein [Sphingobium jiangsuense]GLT02941.1 hypothetical protein GCM10007897_43710 [Sphingobium jiangsuense]
MAEIVRDIEHFISSNGMGAATFGEMAMNDRHLVRQLRNGRRLWPETEAKIRDFMARYEAPSPHRESAG